MTGEFRWQMEAVLQQRAIPDAPLRPLIYVDERPGLLIADVGARLPMSPGTATRYHDDEKKNGAGGVCLALEPQPGFRSVAVRARRPALDDAQLRQHRLASHDPQVEAIRLVQDQLNTPTPGAFYEALPPVEAVALAQRFEPHLRRTKGRGSRWRKAHVRRSLALKGRRFETWGEVWQAVQEATADWNAHRHPFIWGRRRRHYARRRPGIGRRPKVA